MMILVWIEVEPKHWVLCYENGTPYTRDLPDHTEVADG